MTSVMTAMRNQPSRRMARLTAHWRQPLRWEKGGMVFISGTKAPSRLCPSRRHVGRFGSQLRQSTERIVGGLAIALIGLSLPVFHDLGEGDKGHLGCPSSGHADAN